MLTQGAAAGDSDKRAPRVQVFAGRPSVGSEVSQV
jgi:hypothetical protein